MSIEWRDSARRDVIRFQMIDPNNLDIVFGDLTDVQLGSSELTYGYYTDTRYSCGISFLKSNNYVENAWVRIIHDVPAAGYSNELGTFVPTSPSESWQGAVVVTLDLQSPLWAIKDDLLTAKFSIAKKTSIMSAVKRVLENCNRPYVLANPNDVTTEEPIVYDVGESYLTILHDLCAQSGNRADIDGHGQIVIEPLKDHASMTPSWTLDADDPRGMIIQGTIRMESEITDLPSRIIVVNGNAIGVADLPDGGRYSAHQRGYVKAEKIDDKTATNASKANAAAMKYLDSASMAVVWSMDTLYFPAHTGENVTFILDGEKHICMIQGIDPVRLDTMTMGLTLREVFYDG